MCVYEDSLDSILKYSKLNKRSTYTTGTVAKILGVSMNTIILLCDEWNPEDKTGLECYRVGTHRRIPHHSIIYYLKTNAEYNLWNC